MYFKTKLERAAYDLAMLTLQSSLYKDDFEVKEAVDAVLGLTLLLDKNNKPDDVRTVESDLAEDR